MNAHINRLEETGLSQALGRSGDAAVAIAPDRRIVFWNRAAERLLGYAPGEAIGRTCCDLLEVKNGDGASRCHSAAAEIAGGSVELHARTKAGQPIRLNVSTLALPPKNGEGVLAIHFLRSMAPVAPPRVPRADESERRVPLTPREFEVLRLLASGANTRVAAQRLGVSSATLRNHVQNLLGKLGVHSRLEAVAHANAHGLLVEERS